MRRLITVSEMRSYRSCPRHHRIKYQLGYRPVSEASPLSFGKLIHTGLETWWRIGRVDFPSDVRLARTLESVCLPGSAEDPFAQVKVEELLRGYHCMWEDSTKIALAVEAEFRTRLRNPITGAPSHTFDLGGKLDLVVAGVGHQWIVEHKTTSDDITLGSNYWRRLELDSQISHYYVGARALGYEPRGCVYDVIRKPLLRPSMVPVLDEEGRKIVLDACGERVRTKDGKKWRETGDTAQGYVLQVREETPDEFRRRLREDIASKPEQYFARGEVVRLEDDEREAAADAWQTAAMIREAGRLGRYPRNPDACSRWGRMCEYFEVCTRSASLKDESLFRRSEAMHEELEQVA